MTAIKYFVKAEKFGGGDESDNLNSEMGFIINTGPNRKYDIIVGSKEEIEKRRLAFENQDRNS